MKRLNLLKYKKIFLYSLLVCLFYATYFLIAKKSFTTCADQITQFDVFYYEWFNLIKGFLKGRGLPLYSWNLYLGTDFFSSMAYYCVGDIYQIVTFPLYLLTNNIKLSLTVETYLCTIVSSLLMYSFLERIGIKHERILISSSLIYSFCGFSSFFYGEYLFHRFVSIFPLIFIGIEEYFSSKKPTIFIISVFILFLQNYYFMWPVSIFVLLYCVAKEINMHNTLSKMMKDASKLVIYYLIGLLLASFLLIPAVINLTTNTRLGVNDYNSIFWPLKTYIGLFFCYISPSFPAFTNYNNIFFRGDIGQSYHYCTFFACVSLLFFLSSIKYVLRKNNIGHRIVLTLLFLITIFTGTCSMMNGFSAPSFRWMFIMQFYLIYLGANEVNDNDKVDVTLILVYLVIGIVLLCILFNIDTNVNNNTVHYLTLILSLFVGTTSVLVYNANKNLGLILNVAIMIVYGFVGVYQMSINSTKIVERFYKDEVSYYESFDHDLFYRYYIPKEHVTPSIDFNYNRSLIYGIKSSKTYNTTYDGNTNLFNSLNGENSHYIDIKNPYSLNAIGTKYWIVYDEKELPSELEFEYAHPLSDMKVYRNCSYKGFSYTLGSVDFIENFKELEDFDKTIFVENKNIDINKYNNGEKKSLTVTSYNNNSLNGEIQLENDGLLLFPIPNNKGWNVFVNDKKIDTINVDGGLMGIELEKGNNEIYMYFISPGLNVGLLISFISLISWFSIRKLRKNIDKQ